MITMMTMKTFMKNDYNDDDDDQENDDDYVDEDDEEEAMYHTVCHILDDIK